MYLIKKANSSQEEYLSDIIDSIAFWRSIELSKTFASEKEAKDFLKLKRADDWWINFWCRIQYIHPLNITK